MMLLVKHHSGQEFVVNPALIERIYPDTDGAVVIRYASGIEDKAIETFVDFCAAMGGEIVRVSEPDMAQLPAPGEDGK